MNWLTKRIYGVGVKKNSITRSITSELNIIFLVMALQKITMKVLVIGPDHLLTLSIYND